MVSSKVSMCELRGMSCMLTTKPGDKVKFWGEMSSDGPESAA